jgi:hypothetical protein
VDRTNGSNGAGGVRVLAHPPAELLDGRLTRLGEGVGKVVYASRHWVVKRQRRQSEILALIVIWKAVRRMEKLLPFNLGRRLLEKPAQQIRALRIVARTFVLALPRSVWLASHAGEMWEIYHRRDRQGESLAEMHLMGTAFVPERVTFPPVKVKVGGWPGWLVVSEATERVESTLAERINNLARARRFDEIEIWLDRLLELRQAVWRLGLFSLDAHLKNYGVTGDRVVLLDAGGLTNRWQEIQDRLGFMDELTCPHEVLGLDGTLRDRPDIAERFDTKWKATVNADVVRKHWPVEV